MKLIDTLELKRSIAASAVCEDGKHIFDIIDEQPTIEERKTGRWITHKIKLNGVYNSYCECTACGHTRPTTLFPLYYCPNCGAKMEGETNG